MTKIMPVPRHLILLSYQQRPFRPPLFVSCVLSDMKLCSLSGSFAAFHRFSLTEKHRNAPDTGKTHKRVDDTADRTHLPAEEKCHAVKAEQANTAPVECADDGERQCDLINDHEITSFWYQSVIDSVPEQMKNYTTKHDLQMISLFFRFFRYDKR